MNAAPPPTLVYIAGYGRSGSTVLDLLLGAAPGVTAVGELFMFFRLDETIGCSCGQSVQACPFWSAVRQACVERVGASPPGVGLDYRRSIEGLAAIVRARFLGSALREDYVRRQRALVEALTQVAGDHTLVDSSKTAVEVAWRPIALARWCGLPVRVIHLVRDGRAVMWSLLRGCNRKLEQGAADPRLAWPRLRSIAGWIAANLAVELQSWLLPRGSVMRVSYERLVHEPAAELTRLGAFLGVDLSPVAAQLAAGQPIAPGHSISGNRLRRQGVAALAEDDEWRTQLGWPSRALYWFCAWPFHLWWVRAPNVGRTPAASSPR